MGDDKDKVDYNKVLDSRGNLIERKDNAMDEPFLRTPE